MTQTKSEAAAPTRPLRLWPGVLIVALQCLSRFVVPLVVPEAAAFGVMAGLAGGLAVIVWWVFFSRARWTDRLAAVGVMAVVMLATSRLVHPSIATGMMGFMFAVYALPLLSLAFVAWAVACRNLSPGLRRASMIAAVVLGCGALTLVRTDGLTGDADSDFHWRWAPTPEQRLLAQEGAKPVEAARGKMPAPEPARLAQDRETTAKGETSWPGFRGPDRDGVIRGVRIATNWTASPPAELWRRAVGPGWSSFAVRGDFLYTQEQRGEDEIVACYRLTTGDQVWQHRDAARFWESNAGAGPRATPTLHDGRVYTFGATGIVNALDALVGSVRWTRNASVDTGRKVPGWGFAGSPLVVGDSVIVAAAGKLIAYDLATGNPRWLGPPGGSGYSSPHLVTLHGVAQIVLLNGAGAVSVTPADGKLLWRQDWPGDGIVQPAVTADGDILIGSGSGIGSGAKVGLRCIAVAPGSGGWKAEERWTTNRLKPYYNDFVVHAGHAYGFDGNGLTCLDLKDGERKWKGGRYGHGQVVLLANQDLLLVQSEQGELALVRAIPGEFTELARFRALEGKTWNHPVLAGNVLLVRNDREMAAFRLL